MPEIHPALVMPPDYKLGPCMTRLSDKQRAFVVAMLDYGGVNNKKAALMAGYADGDGITVTATRLAHDEDIIKALHEESARRLRSGSVMAVRTLLQIADDVGAEKKDRLKAIEMILNRSGHHAISEHKVDVTHHDATDADLLKEIRVLAQKSGIDATKLLGNMGIVDAEFEEVLADDLGDLL